MINAGFSCIATELGEVLVVEFDDGPVSCKDRKEETAVPLLSPGNWHCGSSWFGLCGWIERMGGLDGKMRVSYRRGGLDLLTRDTMCEQFLASILI